MDPDAEQQAEQLSIIVRAQKVQSYSEGSDNVQTIQASNKKTKAKIIQHMRQLQKSTDKRKAINPGIVGRRKPRYQNT